MAISSEQVKQAADDFGGAFNEPDQAPVERTDDDAFGLTPPVEADDGIPESPEQATEVVDDAPEVGAEAGAEQAAEPTGESAAASMTPEDIAREVQRLKTWEGRLKAFNSQMKAKGFKDEGEGGDESMGEEQAETPAEELGEVIAEKVAGMSPDEAMQTLAADFGDDFVKMLGTIIDAKVAQASEGVSKSVDEIIEDIVDGKTKWHFETIVDRHPDFMDIAEGPEFAAFIDAMPEADKAEAQRVVDSGSASRPQLSP